MPSSIEVILVSVLVRNDLRQEWPLDLKARVVPSYAPFKGRRIVLVHEVEGLCILFESDKTMGETLRHVHHLAVVGRQFGPIALSKSGGILSQVEDDVKERT